MKKIQLFVAQYFFIKKPVLMPAQYLLVLFLIGISLPACRVKEGCTGAQKAAYTNNMERTKKRGKTTLFPKSMKKKMKH